MQRFSLSIRRLCKKYRELFNGYSTAPHERVGTIFQEIRETAPINECRIKALNIMNSFYTFFNENYYPITKTEFEDMQIDDLLSVYELLLEKNLQKKREYDRIRNV